MANIKISDLRPTGSELFSDSESYMSELGDNELDSINGASLPLIVLTLRASSGACARVTSAVFRRTATWF